MRSLYVLAFVVALLAAATATFMYGFDCPDGHVTGDEWQEKPGCSKCVCAGPIYTCEGCGSVSVPDGFKAVYNTDLNYPECCDAQFVKIAS